MVSLGRKEILKPKKDQNRSEKPKRTRVSGFRDILTVEGKDPGYVYRWVCDSNETGQRIRRFLNGGYDFARAEQGLEVGENNVFESSNMGSIVRTPAGQGDFLYLMRIDKETYDEDQKVKQEEIRETERQLQRDTGKTPGNDGLYGSVTIG
jgi:hypothetical protein